IQHAIDYVQRNPNRPGNLCELHRAGALLAALMAMTTANLGLVRDAGRWWRTARRIAQQSGDIETGAWVRGREIVRAIYEQRSVGAILRLIDEAESHVGGAPPRALPQLVGGKAQALALAGNGKEATTVLQQLRGIHDCLPVQATVDDSRSTVFSW